MRPPLSNSIVALVLIFVVGPVLTEKPGSYEGITYETLGYASIGLGFFIMFVTYKRYINFSSALSYALNPTNKVEKLTKAWKPKDCKTHKQYQKSLDGYLAQKLPDLKIIQEAGSSRIRADIEIEQDVIIEFKVDFKSTGMLQRLLGQIQLYKKEFPGRDLLIVLAGDVDRNNLRDLEEAVDSDKRVRIVKK